MLERKERKEQKINVYQLHNTLSQLRVSSRQIAARSAKGVGNRHIQKLWAISNFYLLLNYYTNHCTYIKFIKFTH